MSFSKIYRAPMVWAGSACRNEKLLAGTLLAVTFSLCGNGPLRGSATPPPEAGKPAAASGPTAVPATPPPPAPGAGPLYIKEYRVSGSKLLTQQEIGETVYPFLGPGRTADDVEKARAALEKAYQTKAIRRWVSRFLSSRDAAVSSCSRWWKPKSDGCGSRVRVIFPSMIRKKVPSLAEGKVPNFNDVTREFLALNQWPDRRVTP